MNETAFSFDPDWMGTLTAPFMTNAFLAGLCIALAAGVMGYFTIARHSTFAAHALAHIGLPGATGAVLLGLPVSAGLGVFALGGALVIGALGKRHRNAKSPQEPYWRSPQAWVCFRTLVQFRLAADAIDSFRLHPDDHGRADRRICGFRRVVAGRFGRYLSTAAVQLA